MLSLSAGHDARFAQPPDPPPFGRSRQVQRALDLIGDTLGPLEAMANDEASPVAAPAGKVAAVLRALETYVSAHDSPHL